ncbi:hypothetical protein As57867_017824, partial [Aphanomyces stellatus]
MAKSVHFGPQVGLPHELLHHAFEDLVLTQPDLVAVEVDGDQLSYAQLNAQANEVAHVLASHGIGPHARVAVLMERCLAFPIGLVSVLKAGAAMVPLDASFPTSRLAFMLADAGVAAVVTTSDYAACIDALHVSTPVVLVANQASYVAPACVTTTRHDEAFLVYTSGSTGTPKGVPVLHGSAVNVIHFQWPRFAIKPGMRVLQFMALGFDGCQWEVWKALSHGAALVFRGHELGAIETVDVLSCTPTALALLGEPTQYPQLQFVAVGGEGLPVSLKDLWAPHVCLTNCYGPSECAIETHVHEMVVGAPVTIGTTIPNVNCYVLDARQVPVDVGAVGELYLGGLCVSPGYVNLPLETSSRFLPDPFTIDGTMFRTGDLGRMLPDGTFQVLGRHDNQVKLKGYRIELDEVANAIMDYPDVVSAAVIVQDNNHLVAFFTPSNVSVPSLEVTVAARLPTYMVPAVWVGVAALPQNTNGKIDKQALASMVVSAAVDRVDSEAETQLALVWVDVLNVSIDSIGRQTSFYALGGDSITAIRLVSKVKSIGYALTSAIVMKHPRLADMAASMQRTSISSRTDVAVVGQVPLTPIQHFNFGLPWKNVHFFNQSTILKPRRPLSHGDVVRALGLLVQRHDVLRMRFRFSTTEGWSQFILEHVATNVELIEVDSWMQVEAAALRKEESLHLESGPVFSFTMFVLPTNEQYLHLAIHHTLVDLVSYRILIDDLQRVLLGKRLGPKTTSFKEWSERLTAQALEWDASAWIDYMMHDVEPPVALGFPIVHTSRTLDLATTAKLDAANATYGTNIQELALAALVGAFGELKENVHGQLLPLMLEGHGREVWDSSSIDISNTVGWFTSLYPVVLSSMTNLSRLVRHVKQTIRAVPHGGLSYGAIQYLAPSSNARSAIQKHVAHNMSFNYGGRFQEFQHSLFETVQSVADVVGDDETSHMSENIYLHHEGPNLILDVSVPGWLFSVEEMNQWIDLWCDWLGRIIDHCLNPSTIGGRTMTDLPLFGSSTEVEDVEAELLHALHLRPMDIEDIYPVTPLQAGMLSAMMQDPTEYVLPSTMDIRGEFEFSQLQTCWKQLSQQEALLRTVFVTTTMGLYQAVTTKDYSEWTMLKETWPADEVTTRTDALIDQDRGFSLTDISFHRFVGIRISDGSIRVIWTTHHSVIDGWSSTLVVERLHNFCHGQNPQTPTSAFKDYIHWRSLQNLSTSKEFWTNNLRGIEYANALGLPKPCKKEFRPKRQMTKFCLDLPELQSVCQSLQVTPSAVFQTAWAIVLQQYTRSIYIKFGSVVSGRDIDLNGVESIVGVLINTVPVVMQVDRTSTAAEIISAMHSNALELVPHSHASLMDIKRWTSQDAELFDTIFMFGNYGSIESKSMQASFAIEFHEGNEYVDSNVGIAIYPSKDFYRIEISHNAWEVDSMTMNFLCARYCSIMTKLAVPWSLTEIIASFDAPTTAERDLLEQSSNGPRVTLPYELLHHAFEERARVYPDFRAIEFEGDWLSYGELDRQANALAWDLIQKGVSMGSRVAVIMERCLEFPIGLLAILKVGASMLPLDAATPVGRLTFMLMDANVAAIITTEDQRQCVDELKSHTPCVYIQRSDLAQRSSFDALKPTITRHDEAYVVYTSGSTGKPKGVPVLHQAAVNVMAHSAREVGIEEGVRVMQFLAIGFDGFQADMWKALSSGATLVLRSQVDLEALSSVDTITCTPTALSLFGDPKQYPNLKVVSVAGEACSAALRDRWTPHVRFVNLYGPSECAIMTHFTDLQCGSAVTIGRPMPNVASFILDNSQNQVPVGAIGELYLGGLCVSPEYINLPEHTNERFLNNPFDKSIGRVFRTGDLGRLLSNGHFEILGRQDNQVKLKGYRIELEEVAVTISKHPKITSAAVIVKNNSHLIGFFCPPTVSVDELRQTVATHLPVYMVPSMWVCLDVMPQNINGKIDKKALEMYEIDVQIDEPQTNQEVKLANIWAQVLGSNVSEIGRHTSFFSLGGDSITAIRMVAKAKQVGLILTGAIAMKYPTLESMARMTKCAPIVHSNASNDSVSGAIPLTPIQHLNFKHPWENVNYWNLSMTLLCRQNIGLDALKAAVSRLENHHDMLRTRFQNDADSGWTQHVLEASLDVPPNVELICIASFDDLEEAVLQKERSLNLVSGPVYAVTVFETTDNIQYLQFTLHHTIADLVSWRILLDDLQRVLQNGMLSSKTTSFKEWSKKLSKKALEWDPSPWLDYMGNDITPPFDRCRGQTHKYQVRLDANITMTLDSANTAYGTNIQELALAALAESFAHVRESSGFDDRHLYLMMEGHGRESWDTSLDVSSTVGWFTCEYPLVLAGMNNISTLVRQVKQKLRGVPEKGLSYGAIKYLLPKSKDTEQIHLHKRHNISFNYAGRFQELNKDDNLFGEVDGLYVPQHEEGEAEFCPGSIGLSHLDDTLVLDISVPDWILTRDEVDAWGDLWCEWMTRIRDHCLDTETIGGRTLSDVPLLGSTLVVHSVEAELMSTLHLRPLDVEDIYPITPLQSGILSAMIRDPAEYVIQLVFDIC